MIALVRKYRPRTLAEVLGQPETIKALMRFAKVPCSTGMLFHGGTGTGKTIAASALARHLGVAVDDGVLGGFYEIPAGEQDAAAVREQLDRLQYMTMSGSGWRVVVCNEADRMTRHAETIWLDGLERLPPNVVIIFTTNDPSTLQQRFRDRCKVYFFESDPKALERPLKELAARIWKGEGMSGESPTIKNLGLTPEANTASFRLAVEQVERVILAVKDGDDVAAVIDRLDKDIVGDAH